MNKIRLGAVFSCGLGASLFCSTAFAILPDCGKTTDLCSHIKDPTTCEQSYVSPGGVKSKCQWYPDRKKNKCKQNKSKPCVLYPLCGKPAKYGCTKIKNQRKCNASYDGNGPNNYQCQWRPMKKIPISCRKNMKAPCVTSR